MGFEWLAFEIEHAEMFSESRWSGGKRPGGGPPGEGPPGEGGPSREGGPPGEDGPDGRRPGNDRGPGGRHTEEQVRKDGHENTAENDSGYLRIYQTKKQLNLLYLDGMAAGKTNMGTLDTQDRLLVNTTQPPDDGSGPRQPGGMGEHIRATQLCDMGAEYGIDGILRMEAGFEIILCNFTTGVDLVSALQRPKAGSKESRNEMRHLEYVRGVGARYQGITAGRVTVDYSSMVSAFFYPLNLTNPDPTRPELPRLPLDDETGLAQLKTDVLDIFSEQNHPHNVIDWQGAVDMIVTRYSDRLQFLASDVSTQDEILSEISFLLTLFVDYADISSSLPSAIEKCTNHYLLPVAPQTTSDHLIHAAVQTVSNRICKTLFSVRSLLLDEKKDAGLEKVKADVQVLIDYLDWSTWTTCPKCDYDEVCFIAIWPWGAPEDHYKPSCLKNSEFAGRGGYWGRM